MGFFSKLFGKKKSEDHVELEESKLDLNPYPQNKLVRFNNGDAKWSGKFAIVLSREESTENQLKDVYKKDVPYFYKIAVESEGSKFLQLKLPISHLRVVPANEQELQGFKQAHASIKLVKEPETINSVSSQTELTNNAEVDEWNRLLEKRDTEEHDQGHHDHY